MGQVIQNLLANAIKYSRRQATAVIEFASLEQEPGKPP
jgi:signal transduction histidine kinase